jgi:hypothetical protein
MELWLLISFVKIVCRYNHFRRLNKDKIENYYRHMNFPMYFMELSDQLAKLLHFTRDL